MYAGHFAAGIAIKARVPKAPTWALLLGVGFVDVLFGIFVLTGIERAHATPGFSPGFSLDQIAWSHSLLMSLVWSAVFAAPFVKQGRDVALAIAFAVFSHFLLDLPMHPGDLTLWPGSTVHLGLGLWRSMPIGWWFVELALIAACSAYYVKRAREDETFGGRALWLVAALVFLHIGNAPWLSHNTH